MNNHQRHILMGVYNLEVRMVTGTNAAGLTCMDGDRDVTETIGELQALRLVKGFPLAILLHGGRHTVGITPRGMKELGFPDGDLP